MPSPPRSSGCSGISCSRAGWARPVVRRSQPISTGTGCAELKPAGYPARWLAVRRHVPYGIIVYGTELLLIQEKIARSRFKRRTAGSIIGNAAVIVAISNWTANLALDVVTALDVVVPVEP